MLSPTHLHEFKSADKTQSPVMSLYLPEQKLGSHSLESGSSPKFILKGRQTGGVHRGHSWVFRAESYDTMMAWYEDIKALTEKTPQERSEFVRSHSRSISRTSSRRSVSSDGVVDEDDDEPYSAHNSAAALGTTNHPGYHQQDVPRRPSPGGRFPSDIEVNAQRGLQAPLSPSSMMNDDHAFTVVDRGQQQQRQTSNDAIAAAGALPGSSFDQYYPQQNGYAQAPHRHQEIPSSGNGTINNNTHNSYQQSAQPYANHPAVLIAARQRNNNGASGNEEAATMHGGLNNSYQEGTWMAGSSPVEASSIPIGVNENHQQHHGGGLYVTSPGQHQHQHQQSNGFDEPQATSYRELPRTTMNGGDGVPRPAMSERTESDAPTLSSEVPTISHLHVPGEYPRMNMI